MNKRVLIIGLQFHDKENIASVRIGGLLNYLPEFGWTPTLVTLVDSPTTAGQSLDRYEIIDVFHRNILWRILDFFNGNDISSSESETSTSKPMNPVRGSGLILHIVAKVYETDLFYFFMVKKFKRKIVELNSDRNFDAVISTSPMPIVHNIARALNKKQDVPWIADLRDLWADNHYHNHGFMRSWIIRKIEKKHLRHASALTTVSNPLADRLRQRYPGKKIVAIANGYDPLIVNQNPEDNVDRDCFSIVYTGILYEGKRDPSLLFQAVRLALDQGLLDEDVLRIKFFGRREEHVIQAASEYGLEEMVQFLGLVSRDQSLVEQRKAQMLLLLTWDNPEEAGVFTGKVFEYLAAKRPIIHIGYTGGVITELLNDTGSGKDFDSVEELSDFIALSFRQFQEKGMVELRPVDAGLQKYSHVQMASSFSDLMNDLLK